MTQKQKPDNLVKMSNKYSNISELKEKKKETTDQANYSSKTHRLTD